MAIDRKKIKICLIGADGSGKTSISTILNKELPLSDIVWCGAESYIMRPIRYFLSLLSKTSRYTKQENLDNNSYRDFRSKRASFISQFSFLEPVYIFFVMLDYRLQYIFKVVKKTNTDYIILDRYFFDVAVNIAVTLDWDKEKLIRFIRKELASYLIPEARFYIKVPPQISMERKSDIPNLEYIISRNSLYDAIAKEFNFIEIDGTSDLTITSSKILRDIDEISKSKKIIYIHSNNDDVGGADFCLGRMCGEVNKNKNYNSFTLLRLDTEISNKYKDYGSFCVTRNFIRPQKSRGLAPIILLPFRSISSLIFFMNFYRKQKPDWIHVNDLYDFIPAIAARILGIKTAFHIRMIVESKFQKYIYGFLVNNFSDITLSVSNAVRNHYFGTNINNKHKVLRDWTDDSLYKKAKIYNKPKEYLGFDKVIIMVGRIEAWKGQHIFIEAIKKIINYIDETIGIFIVGGHVEGSSNIKYYNKIKNEAHSLNIHMLGNREDVFALLTHANVSVHASITPDPFPGVVVESMMTSTYCIGSNSGGVSEMIEDGISGSLFTPKNSDELAKILVWAIENEDKTTEIASNGSISIRELTNKKVIMDRLLSYYKPSQELNYES